MSLVLVTGDLGKAVNTLMPDICVNFTTPRGSAITPLGSVLYKRHPEYMDMIAEVKSSYARDHEYYGSYKWVKESHTGQILVAAFPDVKDSGERMGETLHNILEAVNRDAIECGATSIIISHYKSGFDYSFCDFIDDIKKIFDERLTVYVATTDRYAKNIGLPYRSFGNRMDRPGFRVNAKRRYATHG